MGLGPIFCGCDGMVRLAGMSDGTDIRARLAELLEPAAAASGYELVDVEFGTSGRRAVLRLYIDRADGEPVTLEDCETASRGLGAVLDVADPIERAYDLEVSSPGFDRPLRTRAHFQRFLGHEARVELSGAVEGRRRFRGRLAGLEAEELVMVVDGREWRLPLDRIRKARLAE